MFCFPNVTTQDLLERVTLGQISQSIVPELLYILEILNQMFMFRLLR